jgi:hypothetical protein
MAFYRYRRWAAVLAVLIFYFLALNSLRGDSPTMDEQNHIARGLAYLRTGDPRLSVEHPPLVNMLSALPLLTMPEISLPLDAPSWQRQPPDVFWYQFADELIWTTNRDLDLQRLFFLARLPIVYLTIVLALAGWRFAQNMWGGWAPLLVFCFLLFDPNVLAHGRYVTTDLGGTLFIFLATYLLWRLWQAQDRTFSRWLLAALGLGLALAAKLSALVFLPIWFLLALLPLYGDRAWTWPGAVRRAAQFVSAAAAALLVVWAVFGFEWGPFHFLDARLAPLNAAAGPLPTYLAGIERILLLSQGGRPAFLMGEFSSTGFPLYFPIAFAVKTPLPTLTLLLVALILLIGNGRTRRDAVFLLLPALAYMAISMVSALNIGYRHLLPILPFVYMLIGGLAAPRTAAWLAKRGGHRPWTARMPLLLASLLAAGLLLGDARLHPHYLSSFNSLAGGPQNGHRLLVDSNIDWGQDLLRLRRWAAENEVAQLKLGWFGTADPDYYGLAYQALPGFPRQPFLGQWTDPPFNTASPEPGVYAISVSALWELPLAEKNVYPWFRQREADDRVGYSILIYRVPP